MNAINLSIFYLGTIELNATYLNVSCPPDGATLLDEPFEKAVFNNDFSADFFKGPINEAPL